jgi:hypothetical protein
LAKAVILKMAWVSMSPPLLDIYVKDPVKQVFSLWFDNKQSDVYGMMSPTRIRVTPPTPEFRKINVFVEPYSLNAAGVRVALEGAKYISGAERLLQVIARLWMTEPGTMMDAEGVGILVTQKDVNAVGVAGAPYLITERLERMKSLILKLQRGRLLSDDETLLDIKLLAAIMLGDTPSAQVYTRVITVAGSLPLTLSTEV